MTSWNFSPSAFFKNYHNLSQVYLPGLSRMYPARRLQISAASNDSSSSMSSPLIVLKYHIEEQHRMDDAQQCSHTIKSHGVKVLRTHMHDWLILILLVVIEITLLIIEPFYRFVGEDMMTDLKYPLKSNTVPVWAVPIYAILLPLAVFLFIYYRRKDVYDLHHAILGLCYSILVTAVITDAIKNAVGRPRPDFFWRCFPDGKPLFDHLGDVICHGDKSVIKEGHKSFPSGHTSWSFAGLGFLSLYLSGKIKAFNREGHVAKLCIVFLPLLAAALVGVSRVDDYWHHWQDVFAGGLLGLVVATFCYLQFFPPPYHHEGHGPYAYFRVLEELRQAATAAAAVIAHHQPEPDIEAPARAEGGEQHDHFPILSLDGNTNPTVEEMQAERR